jgi:hypothetical protein
MSSIVDRVFFIFIGKTLLQDIGFCPKSHSAAGSVFRGDVN